MRRKLFRWPVIVAAICGILIGLCSTFVVGGTAQAQIPPQAQDASSPTIDCEITLSNTLSWFGCPIVVGLQEAVTGLNAGIDYMLTVKTDGPGGIFSEPGYKTAWASFRVIAIGMLVVAGLLMLASQAFGFEIFDAYTVKKLMPRLVISIIFIVISWDLLKFFVTMSNVVGNSIRAIIYQPFVGLNGSPYAAALEVGDWTQFVLALVTGASLATLGLAALLSFIVTAAVAVAVAFLILLIRQMLIVLLVIFAPVAIALNVLPGTQKGFGLWKNTGIALLFVFPVISGVIASGRVFALIAYGNPTGGGIQIIQQLSAFGAFFLPYFLIPFIIARTGGALASVTGAINDRARGLSDRAKNFRTKQASQRFNDARSGKGTYVGANALGAVYRRATLPGNVLTRRGRARYRGESRALMQNSADEVLKQDNGRMANDDTANALAQQDMMTRGEFIRRYQQETPGGATAAQAREALGELESSYGARLGSGAMRVAAYKARAASVTGYGAGDYESMAQDAVAMERDNLMSRADTVSAFKANKTRADISGVGFGAWMGQLEASSRQIQAGGPAVTGGQAAALRADALNGSQPGALVGGRREAVEALAPQMVSNLRAASMQAAATGDDTAIHHQLAAIAGRYDTMAQISPQNAEVMAHRVMGQQITLNGRTQTIREHIEVERNGVVSGGVMTVAPNAEFLNMRREYASAAAAGAAAAAGTPPGTPPGSIPTPPNSDRRLKQNIKFIGVHPNGVKMYRFRYFWSDQEYVGVMAQDLVTTHPKALSKDSYGYYTVNYEMLGMRMYTIEQWTQQAGDLENQLERATK